MKKYAIIAGAGPAGLTAAYELLTRTDIVPLVFEKSGDIGGISKTVNYKGNRMDIGGHRFFSKSDRVMEWWVKFLPVQGSLSKDDLILEKLRPEGTSANLQPGGPDPEKTNRVMLIRSRLSRIFYLRKFFDYPISLSLPTLRNLGICRIARIGWSYLVIRLFPIKAEKNLEDFFINRFGKELYLTFFKDYTEKVWGVPCNQIKPEWGAQRIKGLSVSKAIVHAMMSIVKKKKNIEQKNVETSLIDRFMYPKLGPGQLWEEVARHVVEKGGSLILNKEISAINWLEKDRVLVSVRDTFTKEETQQEGTYFFSTMPVKELIKAMVNPVPDKVKEVAAGLVYRDFITVGLLLKKLKIKNETKTITINNIVPDNWIYIQERDVKIGRLQIFNNWSPYMVADENTVWIGLEYFCNEGDQLWNMEDRQFIEFAIGELQKIDIIHKEDVLDSTIIRVPKTYPAYFGTYQELDKVIAYTSSFENMFLIGRNGMHRYNNQDHSMLTAMVSVDQIVANNFDKKAIWEINMDGEYHETKTNNS